jgi:hypothetical protein
VDERICSECGAGIGYTFLVPVAIAPLSGMRLRLNPAKNNQRSRNHFAADYEIARGRWSGFARSSEAPHPLTLDDEAESRSR